jgi:hypothetical protein
MRFGALPDEVIYALVLLVTDKAHLSTTETLSVGQRLRHQDIGETPGEVIRTVIAECEHVVKERKES